MEGLEREKGGRGVLFEQQGRPPERMPSCLQESHLAAARPSFSSSRVPTLLLTRPPPFRRASSSACWFSVFFLFFYLDPPLCLLSPPFSLLGPPCRTCTSPARTKKKSEFRAPLIDSGGVMLRSGPGVTCPGIQRSPGFKNVGHLK